MCEYAKVEGWEYRKGKETRCDACGRLLVSKQGEFFCHPKTIIERWRNLNEDEYQDAFYKYRLTRVGYITHFIMVPTICFRDSCYEEILEDEKWHIFRNPADFGYAEPIDANLYLNLGDNKWKAITPAEAEEIKENWSIGRESNLNKLMKDIAEYNREKNA